MHQTAFFSLTWGNLIMIAVACFFLYLAIRHEFEPLLLVPIAFGMLLVNIYPDIMLHAEDSANGTVDCFTISINLMSGQSLPSLIFLGVGAMTDFGPLIANPKSFLLGAAAQFGIFAAYLGAMAMGFSDKAAAAGFYYRRCRWADIYFPCRKAAADGADGSDCGGGVFLYVAGSDYPAADYETSYDRRRAEN